MPEVVEPVEHSPGDILAELLQDLSLASAPGADEEWPVYVEHLPDLPTSPERILACSTTTPTKAGVEHVTGRTLQKHGVQVRVRAPSDPIGYQKAASILQGLDRAPVSVVVLGTISYTVHRVSLASGPLRLGKTKENRFDYTLNFNLSVTTPLVEE